MDILMILINESKSSNANLKIVFKQTKTIVIF